MVVEDICHMYLQNWECYKIDKNMNKKDLVNACELSPATISKMGKFVSIDVLYHIRTKYGISSFKRWRYLCQKIKILSLSIIEKYRI